MYTLASLKSGEHSTLVTVKADESKLVLTKFLYKFSAISLLIIHLLLSFLNLSYESFFIYVATIHAQS